MTYATLPRSTPARLLRALYLRVLIKSAQFDLTNHELDANRATRQAEIARHRIGELRVQLIDCETKEST